jgi:hypothetical protein
MAKLPTCPTFIALNAELAVCHTSSLRSSSPQTRSKPPLIAAAQTGDGATMRPSRIFTRNNLLRIQQMAREGSSSIEIAKSIGSTPASVRVKCCQHKIKIRRGHRFMRNALSKPVHPLSVETIVAHLPASLSTEFHRKAKQLQIPASVLAGRLLAAIVESSIYEAVLDDKD